MQQSKLVQLALAARFALASAVLSLLFLQPYPAWAVDALEEVMASADMYHISKPLDKRRLPGKAPVAADNLSLLCNKSEGHATRLADAWLGQGSKDFDLKVSEVLYSPKIVTIHREYLKMVDGVETTFEINILLPRPGYTNAAKYDLLTELTALKPPILKVNDQVPSDLQGNRGSYYTLRENGEGFLVLHLAKEAVLTAKTAKAEDKALLLALVRSLTLGRFNQKLNT